MNPFLLSCDWGTSSFRLRLVDVRDRQVIGEVLSDYGIAATFNDWESGDQRVCKREEFYLKKLQQYVNTLSEKLSLDLEGLPVIISGMASSSIGIKELPYSSLPFSIDGIDAHVHSLDATRNFQHEVYLISGVSNGLDVMRGEETQVIGLSGIYSVFSSTEGVTCILPGTHSKHLKVKNDKIVDFKTYMTGELFYLMTHYSILKNAVAAYNRNQPFDGFDSEAFCRGIEQSGKYNLLHTLFSVRINQLFEHLNKKSNYFYLSGLLIGTELRELAGSNDLSIMLCSGSSMFQLYQRAITKMGLLDKTTLIGAQVMDQAVVEGHFKIFQNLREKDH